MNKLGPQRGSIGPASKFAAALVGARVLEDVTFPGGSGLRCKMRILSRKENQDADAKTRAYMEKIGVDLAVTSSLEYQAEVGTRTLAVACRDFDNPSEPMATADEWREFADDGLLNFLWVRYEALLAAQDPVAAELTKDEIADLEDALKKKDVTRLKYFGAGKLSLFLLTTEDRRLTSLAQKSGSGSPSQELDS